MTGAVKRIGNAAALRSVAGPAARAELDCIASEGFRESDLILARHRAHAEGLSFSGDLDAIRVLRKNGMSIAPKPSKADRFPQIVSQEEIDAAEARDRRKKVRGAVARIAAFVAAPTAAAAAYFLHFATPMYSTYSEFVIQRPDSLQQAMTGPGAAMAGAALSGGQDAISVQGYLTSRAAFNELDALEGFVSHFSSEEIDLLQRIPAGADREAQYRTYERRVKVGFDPTEGIVRMQVQAADPETSRDMSLQLIALAETHLDEMTAQLRADQVATAQAAKDRADAAVAKAQSELVDLQEGLSVLSGDLEMSLLQEQIGETQSKLSSARIEREELLANRRPNETRLAAADLRIRLLGDELTDQRAQITQASSGGMSMARAQGELAVLQAELASLQQVQTQNVIALEQARLEAGRQVRYLSLGVEPVLPGAPEFPRPFIHTLMAFGAILGIYLLAALTVSLIREQILEG